MENKPKVISSTVSRTTKAVNLQQLGRTGLNRYGPYIYEEFLPELRWPRAGRVYQEMADNDPVIGAIMYLAEMLIRGTTWDVKASSDSAEDIAAAEFLKSCMDDMEMSWANTISEILSMLTYGFSLHEILYKVRRGPFERSGRYKSKYSDGKIGWRALPIRSQRTLEGWIYNKNSELVGVEQRINEPYKAVIIPMSKALLFRTRVTRENPEGKSLLRNAYRPWFFKKHFEEIEGIGIERDLAGFPVLQAPQDLNLWDDSNPEMVALRARAEEMVQSVRRDSEEGLLLPYGWDLKLLTSGSARQIDIGATIERYDNRIAITMLSDLILLGGKSGSFALADTKQSMLAAALQSQLENIADVFNTQAVPKLLEYNNMLQEEPPKIVPGYIETPALKEVALMLRAMGLDIAGNKNLLDHLYNLMNLPKIDEETYKQYYLPQAEAEQEGGSTADTTGGTNPTTTTGTKPPELGADSAEKEFEQNDLVYDGDDNL